MNIYFKNRCLRTIGILSAFLTLISCTFTACTHPQPPWSDVKVYTDASQKIMVNAGDSFIIGYTVKYDLFPIIRENYDNSMIKLLDKKIDSVDERNQSPTYSWFLFKALRTGETQITIKHLAHITEALQDQQVFTIVIK
jgi:hypothetical protein